MIPTGILTAVACVLGVVLVGRLFLRWLQRAPERNRRRIRRDAERVWQWWAQREGLDWEELTPQQKLEAHVAWRRERER